MGRTFKLHIFPSQNLLSEDFKYLQTANNGTQEITHTLKDNCYYRSDTTALDLCEGVVRICTNNFLFAFDIVSMFII